MTNERRRKPEAPINTRFSRGPVVVAAATTIAASCFLIAPFFAPRGEYGWGHHHLLDLVIGLPLALAAACAWIVAGTRAARRRRRAFMLIAWWVILVGGVAGFDVTAALWLMRRATARGDPDLGWTRPPHLVVTSARGPDTPPLMVTLDEHGYRNPPGTTRADIAFIGDSFTDALQVSAEETFVHRVASATGLDSVNLGSTGYGPQQELGVLRRHALRYAPRYVVWQLYEGNDLDDALRFSEWERNGRPRLGRAPRTYMAASHVVLWLGKTIPDRSVTIRYTDGGAERFRLRPGRCPSNESAARAMQLLEASVGAGADFCRNHDIQLLLVLVPSARRVLAPYLSDAHADAPPAGPSALCEGFLSSVAVIARTRGIPVIDVTTALEAHARVDNRRLYFATDPHFDVAGHAVVSREIAKWIAEREPRPSP